ncbi:hypothetical protein BSG18_57620 [Pseudomonas ogarae]|nr:hypothetical protein BSF43_53170 [Pseudomonas ogarae]PBJ15017.1 hypothetical protein BSG18_57620 [Pseudomonas ogarae]
MAQRGYLGIHAEVPTAQHLRSAIVVNGASEINVHREAALEPTWFRVIASLLWERACSRRRCVSLR